MGPLLELLVADMARLMENDFSGCVPVWVHELGKI